MADATDQGTAWHDVGFDDSAWPTGLGLFGNDTTIQGYINAGGFQTTINGTGSTPPGPQTVYYRIHFNWSGSVGGVVLTATNYIDDAYVMYLNGREISRYNITADPVVFSSPAVDANPGGEGNPVIRSVVLSEVVGGNPLVAGDNVLAVEVHQTAGNSSDHVWGADIRAGQIVGPCTDPTAPADASVLVRRSATFQVIEQCAIPAATIQWYRNVGFGEELIQDATNATYSVTNALAGDAGVYYARLSNLGGTADSRQATLTVNPDAEAPKFVSAKLGTDSEQMTVELVVDEPLWIDGASGCFSDAREAFNWDIVNPNDAGEVIGVASVEIFNETNILFHTALPWNPANVYRVIMTGFVGGVSDASCNFIPDDTFIDTLPVATAISVGASGSALYTFDAAPEYREFSTFAWTGGANGTADTLDTTDAKVQAFDVAAINLPIQADAGNPPDAFAQSRWSSSGQYLLTRPTGVEGNVIMAHLRNDSGSTKAALDLTYDLTVQAPVVEEIAGHAVYYSFTGLPSSWQRVFSISGDGVSGSKTVSLDFGATPWAAGSSLYVLFVDDNGSGSPDDANEIDNFKASFPASGVPPSITQSPASVTVLEGSTVELTVIAAGSAPLHYQWFKGAAVVADGGRVSGATTARLVITASVPGDSGSYFCRVSNDTATTADSAAATVTVNVDTMHIVEPWTATWSYNTNNLDGSADWTTTGGAGWLDGGALFGTETTAATLALLPAPIVTAIPPPNASDEFLTSYFRRTVNLPALAAGTSYALGFVVDDGAVFYVDGVEIGRHNMPAGPTTYATLAPNAGPEGEIYAVALPITSGSHTIAVEVHQNANTSSDIVFGADVISIPSAAPSMTVTHSGGDAVITWPADAHWELESSANANGPWAVVAGAPAGSFTTPATQATQFFQLRFRPRR